MQTTLIFVALLLASASALTGTGCACTELQTQADCQAKTGCTWGTSCAVATPTCTNYNDQITCDYNTGCAWTNAGKCAAFTSCSDYTVESSKAYLCMAKDSTCIPGTVSGTSVTCKSGTLSCSDISDSTVCNSGLSSGGQMCFYITSCTGYDISKCSTTKDSPTCQLFGCLWTTSTSTCGAPTCASITNQSKCGSIRGETFDPNSSTLCAWNNGTCADFDPKTQTASSCYTGSSGTYYWSTSSSCTACSGSGSSNALILAIGIVSLLLF